MNNELERIIDRVKKCMALATSDNPNEAAAALRQAQALMRKYSLDEAAILASDVAVVDVDYIAGNSARPPAWESMLVTLVGKAFGCQGIFVPGAKVNGRRAGGTYRCLGVAAQATMAAHTATVLLRLLRSSRLSHAKQLRDEAKAEGWKATKAEERSAADAFCAGWLVAVREQVVAFANPPEVTQAIQRKLFEQTRGKAATTTPPRINHFDRASVEIGSQAGKEVRLHRPVNTTVQQRALPHRIG